MTLPRGPRSDHDEGSSRVLSFGAQSHGLGTRGLRFAAWVAPPRRKTRFRLLAKLYRTGLPTRRVPSKGFITTSNPPFPSFVAQGLTQIVGRVLRQPYQDRTPIPELNESYIYCLHHRAGEIARQVKQALENEGYEGDTEGLVVDSTHGTSERKDRIVHMRPQFAVFYRPFEGKVYLPRFCVKQNGRFEPLDYFRHLIARVDVDRFDYGFDWPLAEAMREAKDRFLRYQLGSGLEMRYETEVDLQESDETVIAWLVANLRFDFLSHKQLRRIVDRAYGRLGKRELSSMVRGRLGTVKFPVRDRIESFVQEQVDRQTKIAFDKLFDAGLIGFFLECKECRFELPPSIKIESIGPLTPLTHPDTGQFVEKSLFAFAEAETHNSLEKAVGLCLDRDANVLWWYRNKVGPENFVVRAYQKNGVYPDFVVQSGRGGNPRARVIVVESKGKHLEGSRDTLYKRDVARYFERVGKRVPWQRLAEDFKDHVFRFQILDEGQTGGRDWQDELRAILAGQA